MNELIKRSEDWLDYHKGALWETGEKCSIKYEAVHLMTIAREALANRP